MSIRKRGGSHITLIVALAGLLIAPLAFADDRDDILALVDQYGELEDDLAAQAKMIRDEYEDSNGYS
jgi:hypothetical protein